MYYSACERLKTVTVYVFSSHSLQDGLKTALMFASQKGHVQIIQKLLTAGAAVDKKNKVWRHK